MIAHGFVATRIWCFVMRISNTQEWDDAVTKSMTSECQTIPSNTRRDGNSLARSGHAAPDKVHTAHRARLGDRAFPHVFCGHNYLEHCFETAAARCAFTNGMFGSFGSLAGSNA